MLILYMEIQLRKFDMSQITHDKTVVLIGKRDTGKSFLCKDILYHHRNVPAGSVISGTEAANELNRTADSFFVKYPSCTD